MGYELNSDAYKLLIQIEIGVREFLVQIITNNGVHDWTKTFIGVTHVNNLKEIGKRIHEMEDADKLPEIEDIYVKKISKEFKSQSDLLKADGLMHPFYYLSWSELTDLVAKTSNKPLIEGEIGIKNRDILINNLRILNGLRNDVAHARFISENDLTLIKSSFAQINLAIPRLDLLYKSERCKENVGSALMAISAGVSEIKSKNILSNAELTSIEFVLRDCVKSFWLNAIFLGLIPLISELHEQIIQYQKLRGSVGGLLPIQAWKHRNSALLADIKKTIDERKIRK